MTSGVRIIEAVLYIYILYIIYTYVLVRNVENTNTMAAHLTILCVYLSYFSVLTDAVLSIADPLYLETTRATYKGR